MIYVECNADFVLVRFITNVPRSDIAHELQGKGGICSRLRNQSNCIGLIDEDPSSIQPRYVKEAKLKDDLPEHGLRLLHHSSDNNSLIVLCPRLEEWVLRAAGEAGIDVKKYGLPQNGKRLHAEINSNLDRFERLLARLKGTESLKQLKRLLESQPLSD